MAASSAVTCSRRVRMGCAEVEDEAIFYSYANSVNHSLGRCDRELRRLTRLQERLSVVDVPIWCPRPSGLSCLVYVEIDCWS